MATISPPQKRKSTPHHAYGKRTVRGVRSVKRLLSDTRSRPVNVISCVADGIGKRSVMRRIPAGNICTPTCSFAAFSAEIYLIIFLPNCDMLYLCYLLLYWHRYAYDAYHQRVSRQIFTPMSWRLPIKRTPTFWPTFFSKKLEFFQAS